MAEHHDENLPEVVPDSSPQTLTSAQAFNRRGLDEGDQKYTVVNDSAKPKMAGSDAFMGDAETPTTPAPAYRPTAFGAAAGGTADGVAPDTASPGNAEAGLANEKAQPRILGLKKRTFIIVLVVAIIIIAAAIGGGVGGSQAAKKSSSSAEDPVEADEETTSPTSTTAAPSSSTSSSPISSTGSDPDDDDDDDDDREDEEDKDDDDDEPGFDFKGWKTPNFTGSSTDVITEKGFIDLPFNVTSYKWRPNNSDCCVTFCQGKKTSVGWRCTDFEREEATAEFGRIFIGCGDDKTEENSRCS